MPQFDFAHVFWPQVAWLAVCFAVLYFGVVKLTLPKLGKVVDAREGQIAADLTAAKAANDSAESVSQTYARALEASREACREAIGAAKTAGAKASEASLAAAQSGIDGKLAAAEARIADAVAAACQSLRDVAAESAQSIVAKVTGNEPALAAAHAALDAANAG